MEFKIENESLEILNSKLSSIGKIYDKYNIDSLILKNEDELKKFYNLLSNKIKINNMKLLYRESIDGFGLINVKNKINKKSKILFLYLTGNKRIFGAFINEKIDIRDNNCYLKDENAFVFSLNNNKIYNNLIPEYAIRFYESNIMSILIGNTSKSNGFYFINGEKIITDEGLLNNPKVYDFQKNCELTEGDNNFIELEIFEIFSI